MPSPYLYTCLSVRPTFALSRKKKKNTWSQVISTQQLKPMLFCDWHPQWTIDRITHFQTLRLAFWKWYIRFEYTWGREKNRVLGAGFARLHPSFRREMVCFFIYSVFCKNEYHPFPMYTYTCQHLFFFLCLCTKFTGIMKQIVRFSGVLLMLTHFLNWLWHKVDHSLP